MRILTEIIGGAMLLMVFFFGVIATVNQFKEKPDAAGQPVQPEPIPAADVGGTTAEQQKPHY